MEFERRDEDEPFRFFSERLERFREELLVGSFEDDASSGSSEASAEVVSWGTTGRSASIEPKRVRGLRRGNAPSNPDFMPPIPRLLLEVMWRR